MTSLPLQSLRAIIIIPGTVSYFYDEEGRRVAQALESLGASVDIFTLHQITSDISYDWCFLMNLSEIEFSYQHSEGMFQQIELLRLRCRNVAMVLLECVEMKWFQQSLDLLNKAKVDLLIDLGFHNQYQKASDNAQKVYHYVFNGLTEIEKSQAMEMQTPLAQRPIPWTFVGHLSHQRLDFIDNLTANLSRDGYVYLVHFTPVTETGPHLNQAQFHRVLTKTQYKIWCSHHPYFYVESIRFRMALMSGSVPIKVNLKTQYYETEDFPFTYLIFNEENFYEQIRQLDFIAVREQFASDYQNMPTLESGLAELIQNLDKVYAI